MYVYNLQIDLLHENRSTAIILALLLQSDFLSTIKLIEVKWIINMTQCQISPETQEEEARNSL